MRAILTCILSIGILGTLVFAAQDKQNDSPKRPKGKFTISKETTYITGPLDKDGYPDFAAALNERLRQGVTPENNAAVLLWKALGPRPDGESIPPEFFRLMGIAVPPENDRYFIDLAAYLLSFAKPVDK